MPGYRQPGPPPTQALEYLRRKGYKTAFDYLEVWKEQHAQSFTVAKVMEGDLLVDIRRAVDQALADGVPLAEFKKRLEPILEARGWKGYGRLRGEDGKTITDLFGNPQEFELGTPRRLKTIYDTNLRQTRGAAQWTKAQDTKEVLPYFRYTLGPSKEHRADHAGWSDLVLPVDDPFWDTHYPINGWGCKCRVIPITRRKAAKLGGPHESPTFERVPWVNRETGKTELVPEGIDPGFDYNPGKAAGGKIKEIAKEKAKIVKKVVGTKAKPAPLPVPPALQLPPIYSSAPKVTTGELDRIIDEIDGSQKEKELFGKFLEAHPIKALFITDTEQGGIRGKNYDTWSKIDAYTGKQGSGFSWAYGRGRKPNGYTSASLEGVVVKVTKTSNLSRVKGAEIKAGVEQALDAAINNDGPRTINGVSRHFSYSSSIGQTKQARMVSTYIHEVGHQVHYWAGSPEPPFRKYATEYADYSKYEWFAEHFVAFLVSPEKFKQWDPDAYNYIEYNLERATAAKTGKKR